MSKWGLTYKGTEILTPEEWNAVVDALEELDKRAPIERNGGLAVFSGDGAKTEFHIPHGLSAKPTIAIIGAGSQDASGYSHYEVTDTEIIVHYSSPPPSGSDNVKIYWYAIRL
ncbi:MAG: hypothetical protein DRP01_01605 [Archaeoglobales archaeon]|nr:MAG: hypothetical protein DRP01_01605 [Archaeoglobales archaeon]